MDNIIGIYKIESKTKPERIYIGSSSNITNRWKVHLRSLRSNKHHSIKMQRHFNKYGESDLLFSVLLGCDKGDLLRTEQYFLDSHITYFNTSKVAGSNLGIKHTDNARKNMSIAHLGQVAWNKGKKVSYIVWHKGKTGVYSNEALKQMSISHIGKTQTLDTINKRIPKLKKRIAQYDLNGIFIREWDSAKDASIFYKCRPAHISACCTGKRKTAFGFKWKHIC